MPNSETWIVSNPPNYGGEMKEVWAFVSRDAEGNENLCGSLMGPMGMQPLITGKRTVLEKMKPLAERLRASPEMTGKTVHLLRYVLQAEEEQW